LAVQDFTRQCLETVLAGAN